jgi:hypothetical protein
MSEIEKKPVAPRMRFSGEEMGSNPAQTPMPKCGSGEACIRVWFSNRVGHPGGLLSHNPAQVIFGAMVASMIDSGTRLLGRSPENCRMWRNDYPAAEPHILIWLVVLVCKFPGSGAVPGSIRQLGHAIIWLDGQEARSAKRCAEISLEI